MEACTCYIDIIKAVRRAKHERDIHDTALDTAEAADQLVESILDELEELKDYHPDTMQTIQYLRSLL